MKKEIERIYTDLWGDTFTIPQHLSEKHPAYNSLGGSELYTINLFKSVPKQIRDKFNIIVSRWIDEVIDPDKHTIYILQDLYTDPMYEHLKGNNWSTDRISKVVFVSHWQREMFQRYGYNIPLDRSLTLHNAVEPVECNKSKWNRVKNTKYRIVYTSTPQRGLEILFEALRLLRQQRSDFELHTFSGFDIYGFDANNQPYEQLFKSLEENEWCINHGVQANSVVREFLKDNHIFCLPSIWEETSCMAAMEAMYGCNLVVVSAYGALPETVANCGIVYDMPKSHTDHVVILANLLNHVISTYHAAETIDLMKFGREYAKRFYSWQHRSHQWKNLLTNLTNQLK